MRDDIQCLRGIAIILVILFSLWPNIFVNGFLGVDIFFAISGFLIAKSLTEIELNKIGDFSMFYYKRFRRILPLHLVVVFGTIIMVHLYLGEFLWNDNNRYSLASLFLVTNQLIVHDDPQNSDELWNVPSSLNAFLHFWSLSVGMQFYLVAPFIFFGLQMLKNDNLKLIVVSLISIFGFIAFALVVEPLSFNFMFLRLWQFSAGFVGLFWSKIRPRILSGKARNPNVLRIFKSPFSEDETLVISISTIALCLFPNVINVILLRPLVTLATALIIASDTEKIKVLHSKTLSYIGDISYALYLVHWPVITIFFSSTLQSFTFCILLIILSSILLHHLFEKHYLEWDMKSSFTLVFLLLAINGYLQYSIRNGSYWRDNLDNETHEIVKKNMISDDWQSEKSRENCIENILDFPSLEQKNALILDCKHSRGNGSISIMVTGNGYAQHMAEVIRIPFQNNYSEFRSLAIRENFGIYADETVGSRSALEVTKQHIELYKPDVLILLSRFNDHMKKPIQNNDTLVKEINENIKIYENFVKRLYILEAHPVYPYGFLNSFLHHLTKKSENIEYLHLDKVKADFEMKYAKKRLQLVKCQKCHFINLSKLFTENSNYLTFNRDTMMSYVDNLRHLSVEGMKLCEPVFQKVVQDIMNDF